MKKILIFPLLYLFLMASCNTAPGNTEATLLSDTANKATAVSFTTDASGVPVISWCETGRNGNKSFFLSFLDEKNNSFTGRVNIPIEQSASLHEEGMPKLAIKNDGTIIAVYETSEPTKENRFAGSVKYIQSFDEGKTWTPPHCIHFDTTAGESHSYAAVARLQDGEIGASWLDVSYSDNKTGRSVKFAKTHGHNGFSGEMIIDSFACQCCRTAISCDTKGDISIMFRDILSDSIRDMSLTTSVNNGQTFTKAAAFTNDGWVINGCPHNGPGVVNDNGNTYATWFTGGPHTGLYYAALNSDKKITDRKKISSTGKNIQLCMMPGEKKVIAYNEISKTNGVFYSKVAVNKIVDGKIWSMDITPAKSQASYPVLRAVNEHIVAVAWIAEDKIFYRMIDEEKITRPVLNAAVPVTAAIADLSAVKLASTRDLSCGMPISAGLEDTAHYKNKVYGFCSQVCKDSFLKNPEAALHTKK